MRSALRTVILPFLVGTAAGAEPPTFFRIHEGLPACTLRVITTWQSQDARDDAEIRGHVHIDCPGGPSQDIAFESLAFPEMVDQDWFLRIADVDMDGHEDLGILHAFGAKWGGYVHHLYDPATRMFVTTHLSRQLDELLRGNGLGIDMDAGLLIVPYLQFVGNIEDSYRIDCDVVELAGTVDRVCFPQPSGDDGVPACIDIAWSREGDAWLVTSAGPAARETW